MRHHPFVAKPSRRVVAVASGAALAAVLTSAVDAQSTQPSAESGLLTFSNVRVIKPDAARSRPAFRGEGVKAFIDDQTGALVEPSFDELEALSLAPGHRKPEPKALRDQVTVLANGTWVLRAPPSMINLSLARVGNSGGVSIACTPADALPEAFRAVADAEVKP